MNYYDYLNSSHWKNLRNQKKKHRCAICGSTDQIDTHHLIYKKLIDVKPEDLRKLCHRCHLLTHQLHKEGKFIFRSDNHHSRFTLIKIAVKKYLGLTRVNMFKGTGELKPTSRKATAIQHEARATDGIVF